MALAQRMGVAGLALSSAVSSTVYALLLDIPLELRGEGVLSRSFLLDLGKMALATGADGGGRLGGAGLTEGLLPGRRGAAHPGASRRLCGRLLPGGGAAEIGGGQLALKMVKRVWKRG